jgi:phospholipid-binding lipoprotein MlaA
MKSKKNAVSRLSSLALAAAACAVLAGCATPSNPQDPLEKFNRATFAFNDTVDRVALKPAATAYKNVLPGFVQTGVSNFFGNLSDAWSSVNNLLQGKPEEGMSDFTRFALNSSFGIVGLLDIASEAGLQKHNEDFGQTLGVWGVPSGPYLMLPLLGPSTIRDTAALPADMWADPWSHKRPVNWRNVGIGVRAVDQRASVLEASNLFEEAALDRYEFIRDGYLQRRQSRVYDGESGPAEDAPKQDSAEPKKDAPKEEPASNTQVVPEPASSETERK